MSDQKNQSEFESLNTTHKESSADDSLFSGHDKADSTEEKFAAGDEGFDAEMWEEEHVSSFPGFLKAIIILALLFAVALFLYKFLQNPNEQAIIHDDNLAMLSESDLSAEELNADNAILADALIEDDGLAMSNEEMPAGTQEVINEFLDREKASLNNNERVIDESASAKTSDQRANEELLAEVLAATEAAKAKNAAAADQMQAAKEQAAKDAKILKEKQAAAKKAADEKAKASAKAKAKADADKAAIAAALDIKKEEVAAVETAANNKRPIATEPAASSSASSAVGSDVSLKAMDSKTYAVQLIGMNDTAGFEKFVKSLPKELNVHTYQRTRQGKTWNVAVLAPYDSVADATAAIDKLPENLKAQKPWVKSLKLVKDQL